MKIYNMNEQLPKEGRHVLVHYNGGNWIDDNDQEGNEWRVGVLSTCEAWGNNPVPYEFDIGGDYFFGCKFDKWCELPIRRNKDE